jgi:hypothetical protein
MKSGSNFKMSKQSKRYLATIVDTHKRGEIKRGTVQAELAGQQQVRQPRGDRK